MKLDKEIAAKLQEALMAAEWKVRDVDQTFSGDMEFCATVNGIKYRFSANVPLATLGVGSGAEVGALRAEKLDVSIENINTEVIVQQWLEAKMERIAKAERVKHEKAHKAIVDSFLMECEL